MCTDLIKEIESLGIKQAQAGVYQISKITDSVIPSQPGGTFGYGRTPIRRRHPYPCDTETLKTPVAIGYSSIRHLILFSGFTVFSDFAGIVPILSLRLPVNLRSSLRSDKMINEGNGAVERTMHVQVGVPNKQSADDYEQSKVGNEHIEANQNSPSNWLGSIPRDDYVNKYLPPQIAAMKGDWKVASNILTCGPMLPKRSITWTGETALHLAAGSGHISFVKNWLGHDEIGIDDVAHPNGNMMTALAFAALTGNKIVAEEMLSHWKSKHYNPVRFEPLYIAALEGHSDLAYYFYLKSDFQFWTPNYQITLLNTCISSGLRDLALLIFQQSHQLALEKDENGERPLDVLARKPSAFVDASERPIWRRVIKCLFPWLKEAKNETKGHILFRLLWKYVFENEISVSEVIIYVSHLLFDAAYIGNFEFLVELLNSCPELIYKVNKNMESIFHIAICNRDKDIFNLIYEIGSFKNSITSYMEETGKRNNILHKAALLPTKNRLKPARGAAFQMQHELLWFKAVETVVSPLFKEMTNADGLTPHELFLKEHKELRKKGEQEIIDIAKSCSIVAMIIFMAIFTVRGDSTNITSTHDLLRGRRFFYIFTSKVVDGSNNAFRCNNSHDDSLLYSSSPSMSPWISMGSWSLLCFFLNGDHIYSSNCSCAFNMAIFLYILVA